MNEAFRRFAHHASDWLGSPWAFTAAFATVVVWAGLGTIFGFSDSWQLVINTGTTIVTFLMVFLIQNTQNRDNRALHAKLDELIVKTAAADNELVESEQMSDEELQRLEQHFHDLARHVRKRRTGSDTLPGEDSDTEDAARDAADGASNDEMSDEEQHSHRYQRIA